MSWGAVCPVILHCVHTALGRCVHSAKSILGLTKRLMPAEWILMTGSHTSEEKSKWLENDSHLAEPSLLLCCPREDGGELKEEKDGWLTSNPGPSPASSRRNVSKEGPEKLGKNSSGSLRKEGWGPRPLCGTEETSTSLARGESPPKNSVDGS